MPPWAYRRAEAPVIGPVYRALRTPELYAVRHAGGRFELPATDSSLNRTLLLRGAYEPDAAAAFHQALAPGMTVFDIGANIGYYTVLAADAVGAQGLVCVFEPDPRNLAVLERNLRLRPGCKVMVARQAVGAIEGSLPFFLNVADSSVNSMALDNAVVTDTSTAYQAATVPCTTLDGFVRQHALPRPDVIKIDVQGAEMLVFAGATEVLSEPKLKLFLEFWPFGLRQLGTEPADLLHFLLAQGFTLRGIDRRTEAVLKSGQEVGDFLASWSEIIERKRAWHVNFMASRS
jgi:FkbM family methyltransferase